MRYSIDEIIANLYCQLNDHMLADEHEEIQTEIDELEGSLFSSEHEE